MYERNKAILVNNKCNNVQWLKSVVVLVFLYFLFLFFLFPLVILLVNSSSLMLNYHIPLIISLQHCQCYFSVDFPVG